MKIAVPKENRPGETRIPLIPSDAERLINRGGEIVVETGVGTAIGIPDEAYEKVGAVIAKSATDLLRDADMVLRLNKPDPGSLEPIRAKTIHISYLDPFNEKALIEQMAAQDISTIAIEMIPRTTIAQKMDALSSQASLAGYAAVVLAAEHLAKVFPMMTTPAGTISPSRVFIIGAGVAGLQAIATARRMGARVEAFDTRPVVAEQVRSLGAKFIEVDLGETGQTEQGYAKQLTPEQLELQRQAMARHCAMADVVITTAQVFGRKAPLIVTEDMVAQMKAGSVIVDLAVETGGNVAGSVLNEVVNINGVNIVGMGNMPGRVAYHASQMYSANLRNLIEHFWDDENKSFNLKLDDEIIQGCLIAYEKQIRNERLLAHYQGDA